MSLILSDWGRSNDYGCLDNSDKVKDFNTSNVLNPCGGTEYPEYGGHYTSTVYYEWFECSQTKKCIHQQNRCDSFPHPDCIYEKDNVLIAEDEENCTTRYCISPK